MSRLIPEEVRIEQINSLPSIEFLRWDGAYINQKSKAIIRCSIDGYEWRASVNSLISHRKGCPQCSGNRRWSADERVFQINGLENIEFVRWDDGFSGSSSKAIVRCKVDGFEWSSTVNHILSHGRGCPQCAGLRRWTSSEIINKINSTNKIEFISWVGDFRGNRSRANLRCVHDKFEWSAVVYGLIDGGKGCPRCAKTGYDPSKTGYLYVLLSERCDIIKIGISNNTNRRHAELKRHTPFEFIVAGQISGDGAKIAELERYFHGKYVRAGLVGFDGCTEWLVLTDELRNDVMLTLSISV